MMHRRRESNVNTEAEIRMTNQKCLKPPELQVSRNRFYPRTSKRNAVLSIP